MKLLFKQSNQAPWARYIYQLNEVQQSREASEKAAYESTSAAARGLMESNTVYDFREEREASEKRSMQQIKKNEKILEQNEKDIENAKKRITDILQNIQKRLSNDPNIRRAGGSAVDLAALGFSTSPSAEELYTMVTVPTEGENIKVHALQYKIMEYIRALYEANSASSPTYRTLMDMTQNYEAYGRELYKASVTLEGSLQGTENINKDARKEYQKSLIASMNTQFNIRRAPMMTLFLDDNGQTQYVKLGEYNTLNNLGQDPYITLDKAAQQAVNDKLINDQREALRVLGPDAQALSYTHKMEVNGEMVNMTAQEPVTQKYQYEFNGQQYIIEQTQYMHPGAGGEIIVLELVRLHEGEQSVYTTKKELQFTNMTQYQQYMQVRSAQGSAAADAVAEHINHMTDVVKNRRPKGMDAEDVEKKIINHITYAQEHVDVKIALQQLDALRTTQKQENIPRKVMRPEIGQQKKEVREQEKELNNAGQALNKYEREERGKHPDTYIPGVGTGDINSAKDFKEYGREKFGDDLVVDKHVYHEVEVPKPFFVPEGSLLYNKYNQEASQKARALAPNEAYFNKNFMSIIEAVGLQETLHDLIISKQEIIQGGYKEALNYYLYYEEGYPQELLYDQFMAWAQDRYRDEMLQAIDPNTIPEEYLVDLARAQIKAEKRIEAEKKQREKEINALRSTFNALDKDDIQGWVQQAQIETLIGPYMPNDVNMSINERYTRAVQEFLIDNGHELPKYGVDGKIGSETREALLDYVIDQRFGQ